LNNLANILSYLSLVFGFASIIFSLEAHFTFASWAIIVSMIFDGLDGQLARRNPVPSEFGKELDSLVDVVAFGIAPSLLGYIFVYRDFHFWGTGILFIYLFCSVQRLAKYNVTPKEKMANFFYGLPTTVSGGTLASFILIYRKKGVEILPAYVPFFFIAMALVLALLMVSQIRYLNLDGMRMVLRNKKPLIIAIFILIVIESAVFKKAGTTMFICFLIYLLFSPVVVKRMNSNNH